MRNLINLVAVINVLEYIAKYQKWCQKEKASAFERKIARRNLKVGLGFLDDRKVVQQIIEEKFAFIDFETNQMKNCEESFTYVCKSKKEFIDQILKRQKTIADSFLKNKDAIHDAEDPKFLDAGSDVLDLRDWNLETFNPKSTKNTKNEAFEAEMHDMMKKLEKCKKFYEDVNEQNLLIEFRQVLKMIYENERSTSSLEIARDQIHIIDQWNSLKKSVHLLHDKSQKSFFAL